MEATCIVGKKIDRTQALVKGWYQFLLILEQLLAPTLELLLV